MKWIDRDAAWMQIISTEAQTDAEKWIKSFASRNFMLCSMWRWSNPAYQKMEEKHLPGWIYIISLLMTAFLKERCRMAQKESAAAGNVEQSVVEQLSLQMETQRGNHVTLLGSKIPAHIWLVKAFIFRGEDECDAQPQSDLEEELEAPLPLKDDNEWQHCTPFLLPHHDVHSCGKESSSVICCDSFICVIR